MAKIKDYQEMVQNYQPLSQEIGVGVQVSQKWQEHINSNNDVRNAFNTLRRNENDELVITREDVFNAATPIEKVVKALIWGYPNGMQGKENLRNIIGNLNEIVQLLTQPELEQPLNQEFFLTLYNSLTKIHGLKQSTVSKLLYFFNIHVGNSQALIIDTNVEAAFQAFDDFVAVSFEENIGKRYLKQFKKMNSLARQHHFQPDQLEYFLFEFGKHWRNSNNSFVHHCILLMNR